MQICISCSSGHKHKHHTRLCMKLAHLLTTMLFYLPADTSSIENITHVGWNICNGRRMCCCHVFGMFIPAVAQWTSPLLAQPASPSALICSCCCIGSPHDSLVVFVSSCLLTLLPLALFGVLHFQHDLYLQQQLPFTELVSQSKQGCHD